MLTLGLSAALIRPRRQCWPNRAAACLFAACGLVLASPGAFAAAGEGNPMIVPASLEPGAAPGAAAALGDSEIKARLDKGDGLTIAGEKLRPAVLRRFYAAHSYQPVWEQRQAQARALWNAVSRAGEHGLDPEMYHFTTLANAASLSATDRDLLLSDAVLAYADALARGAMPVEARVDILDLSPGAIDIVAAVDAVIASPDPAAALAALAPRTAEYAALRGAYPTYLAMAKAGGWPRLADPRRPEPPAERFRLLQQRLAAEGYLPSGYGTGQFDETTLQAVRAFQERHGIEPDGKLGPATIVELNVSADTRAQQIAVNLERWRWLPRNLPAERVWVNTASMQLEYYRGTPRPIFTTRVVVGQPTTPTPEFATTINSLLYNPPWYVPYSIATKEILPKLETEPDYLERHNMVMRDSGAIHQLPGAGTALGRIKFEMEDRFSVYLHDTPLRHLFARENRRLSHGCVRVQNPRDFAALLIQEPVEVINKGIAPGTTTRRSLAAPVPVYIVYQTAFIGADGALAFRRDAYLRDDAVGQRLQRTQPPPLAGQEPGTQRKG